MSKIDDFPIDGIRAAFPALAALDDGRPRIYFDNPAGTQVPRRVVERMTDALLVRNANLGGAFRTSEAAVALVDEAHAAAADFYNAASPREIVYGQNMTTLTFHMSRCIGRRLAPGDEIVLSRMDHDANVAPWLLLAEERGLKVRWLEFDRETYEFPERAIDDVLSARTRLVAIGYASNLTGTINDVQRIAARSREAGALTYVDAVQFAPHASIDVATLGADFLVSSAYKWFGPHQAVLWGREDVMRDLFAYKVRPAGDGLPDRFETGTLSHEGMAGCLGAIEYLAELGMNATARPTNGARGGTARARAISAAFERLREWEQLLTGRLLDGLADVKGLVLHGIGRGNRLGWRVPTVSFTLEGRQPRDLATAFADRNVFVWSGHNYAIEPTRALGLLDKGGVLRVGLAHYNTPTEVDRFLETLNDVKRG